ncbi:MAG: heparinase II/III family protein [Tepidisphaeraceae bacterium]
MHRTYRPASLDDRTFWNRAVELLRSDPRFLITPEELKAVPDRPALPSASDYLAARRSNDRARVDKHWHDRVHGLALLLANRCGKGVDPNDADDRLLNWLFDLTYEPSWVVSAHLPKNDLILSGTAQFDLSATELMAGLAEGRWLALPWLTQQTQTLDASIVTEIDRRTLTPFGNGQEEKWARLTGPTMNWAGVCAGNILATTLALAAQGFERPAARDRALKVLHHFFDAGFTTSGECDEGIGYWNYGVDFACMGLMGLDEKSFSGSVDVKRLSEVASFPSRAHLIGSTFFASNDSARTASAPISARWLALVTGDQFLNWWDAIAPSKVYRNPCTLTRALWLSMQPIDAAPTTQPTHPEARLLPDQQVGIFQRPTPRGLVTFTVTGGNNVENHNHNDIGTFQFYIDNRALIPDLGAPQYVTDFFGPQRYKKFMVAASSGHCCPSVNGVEQVAAEGTDSKLVEFDAKTRSIELDCTAAYPKEAGLKQWRRRSTMDADGTVTIVDRFDAKGEIVHRIWLDDGEPRTNVDGVVETKSLHLSITPKPQKIEVASFKAGDERLLLREWKADHVLYRVDATYAAKGAEPLTVTTTIQAR